MSLDVYAQLLRRNIHIRVTTRPYPVSSWAADHHANAPAPLAGWRDHLLKDQRHLAGRSMADKEVFVGVEITARTGLYKAIGGLAGSISDHEVASLSKAVRQTDAIMASPGMEGGLVTLRQLEWLLHRSCSLGLPAPLPLANVDTPEWDTEDLHELTDSINWFTTRYGHTIGVVRENDSPKTGQTHVLTHVC